MTKIRHALNILVGIIFIVSTFFLLKFSDLPNYFNLKLFEKPEDISDIALSLVTSLEITSIFYIIVDLIPANIREKENFNKAIPYRCASHRHIQLFLSHYLNLFQEFEKTNIDYNTDYIQLDNLFAIDNVKQTCSSINFNDDSPALYSNLMKKMPWYLYTTDMLRQVLNEGNEILRYHKYDIPNSVYEAIFYLTHESSLCVNFLKHLELIHANNSNGFIGNAVPSSNNCKDRTFDKVKILYDWINIEYSNLKKLKCENIYKISLK